MHPKSLLKLIGLAAAAILLVGCIPTSYGAPSEDVRRSLIQNPHIIEGEYAKITDIPYQVALEQISIHTCGGAIISDSWILCAAHCVFPWTDHYAWFRRVRVGSSIELPIIGWFGKTYGIAETRRHGKYSRRNLDYDIGLIRVKSPIVFGDGVATIPLPPAHANEDTFVNFSESAVASGWGLTNRDGFWSSLWLKKVTLSLMDRKTCVDLHRIGTSQVTPRMICAGGNGKGGTCVGDSGGPLVYKNTVIGIVSWAVRCNDDRLPTIFVNVVDPEIRGYIKNNTGL